MKKDEFRCVECSQESSELYRDYKNGILKITICVRYRFTYYFQLLVLMMLANMPLPCVNDYIFWVLLIWLNKAAQLIYQSNRPFPGASSPLHIY